jgi:uncharacterized protein
MLCNPVLDRVLAQSRLPYQERQPAVEHRAVSELRTEGRKLIGVAAPFGVETRLGDITEVIHPAAFSATLRDGHDVVAIVDHDPTRLLARTRSGSLRLSETQQGLAFELDVPPTSLGQDVLALAERRDLGGMSFGFRVSRPDGERWHGSRRELRSVDLIEVSVVHAFPAYTSTSIQARSKVPFRMTARRKWLETV